MSLSNEEREFKDIEVLFKNRDQKKIYEQLENSRRKSVVNHREKVQRKGKIKNSPTHLYQLHMGPNRKKNKKSLFLPSISVTHDLHVISLSISLSPGSVQLSRVIGTRILTEIYYDAQSLSKFWLLVFSQWILKSNLSRGNAQSIFLEILS